MCSMVQELSRARFSRVLQTGKTALAVIAVYSIVLLQSESQYVHDTQDAC